MFKRTMLHLLYYFSQIVFAILGLWNIDEMLTVFILKCIIFLENKILFVPGVPFG